MCWSSDHRITRAGLENCAYVHDIAMYIIDCITFEYM